MVSQIVDLRFKHIALGWLQLEAVFSEVIEDHSHSLQMLFQCLRENYHVIQVDEAIGEVQFAQTVLHEHLESRWDITQPKRHSYKPILPNVKVVYCLDSSSMGTCQNPELRSKVE